MSSPCPVIDNRPIDQLKVTELREELKRRKLPIKGLKQELVRRLAEAILQEQDAAHTKSENGGDSTPGPDEEMAESVDADNPKDNFDADNTTDKEADEKMSEVDAAENRVQLDEGKFSIEEPVGGAISTMVEKDLVAQTADTETSAPTKEDQTAEVSVVQTSEPVSVSVESATVLSGQDLQKYETQNESGDLKEQLEYPISNSLLVEENVSSSILESQVSEISPVLGFQVNSDFVSTDVSFDEKTELKDNVIANDVKVELDVKPEMVQLFSSSDVPDDAKSHTMDVEEPHDKKMSTEEPGNKNDKYPEVSVVQTSDPVGVGVESDTALSGQDSQKYETRNESEDIKEQLENHISISSVDEAKVSSSNLETQLSSSSVDPGDGKSQPMDVEEPYDEKVSVEEPGNENDKYVDIMKTDGNGDSAEKLELDRSPGDGKSQPMDVEEPYDEKVSVEEPGNENNKYVDIMKTDGNGDSAEKLQLDRSPGDDSAEEDVSEGKLADFKLDSVKKMDGKKEIEVNTSREVGSVASLDDARSVAHIDTNVEDDGPIVKSVKRKPHDQGTAAGSNDTVKRQRKWNSEDLKIPESKKGDAVASTTPKDFFQPSFRRSVSRSDSVAKEEPPKERVVPPSSKVPTNSLLIENFLRPFTLKAVQELLSKTGTVTNFWMDAIKTHCFVSFASVEEAIETRNAVYNLQWPPHGGKLLVAEFVDPQGVKDKVEAPPQSPSTHATPVTTIPAAAPPSAQPQPSPRQQMQNKQLQSEKLPPPPLPEKLDPPIVTLDDLFRKTKATPRIYYLPLSDEQVAEKLKAQGKIIKQ
ncbi:PREDICTED: apoptotic chromatin condensation inducer in the nucleus-like isoform X2 [Nicotiana attenuata]|uniref:apoptotic chromatin condensation inducer in the nucleus-like isoform X2 n=1 Tax=Nicotiana attenuata TaxID=49451 RepID=UPI0009047B41|nr:PREDICTED: apoptotic chromatin condensation inducer in the nucleus-like isoform X2 [Nicotiana attenuata]